MILGDVFTMYDLKDIKSDAHIKVDTLEKISRWINKRVWIR
jgi:hypothetical protein